MMRDAVKMSAPMVVNTALSNGVALLKCDGTPRHCCMSISAISTISNTVKAQACRVRDGRAGIRLSTHASEKKSTAVENPKVIGLRQLTGPSSDGIPAVSQTTTWKMPEARKSQAAPRSTEVPEAAVLLVDLGMPVKVDSNIVKISSVLIFTMSR